MCQVPQNCRRLLTRFGIVQSPTVKLSAFHCLQQPASQPTACALLCLLLRRLYGWGSLLRSFLGSIFFSGPSLAIRCPRIIQTLDGTARFRCWLHFIWHLFLQVFRLKTAYKIAHNYWLMPVCSSLIMPRQFDFVAYTYSNLSDSFRESSLLLKRTVLFCVFRYLMLKKCVGLSENVSSSYRDTRAAGSVLTLRAKVDFLL